MEIGIHLKLINLTEEQNVASDKDDQCSQSVFFEGILRDTVMRCGIAKQTSHDPSFVMDSTHRNQSRVFSSQGIQKDAKDSEQARVNDVISSVLRFIKLKDRYVAFCSLLLKSFLHHSFLLDGFSTSNDISSSAKKRSNSKQIHVLPRTIYGKPYITVYHENQSTRNHLNFSISHQFPFVGAAYVDYSYSNDYENSRIKDLSDNILIGLDIVQFSSYDETKHLYSCEDDYLQAFQDSFTTKEWECIQSANVKGGCRIKEFFIRWSMKEAYTKAIGTGMSTHFHSFESTLFEKEENEDEVMVLSNVVLRETKNMSQFRVIVKHVDGDLPLLEGSLVFIPLFTVEDDRKEIPCGCASIFVSNSTFNEISYAVTLSSMQLSALIEYHTHHA